jgi:hypothetical protein
MAERRRKDRLLEVLVLCFTGLVVLLTSAAVNAVLFPDGSFWDNLRSGVAPALMIILAYPFLQWMARRKR